MHIVLDYQRDELPALVARIAPDAALLLPTVAETFSYTLSELRSLGVPVIATRVGALAERIRDGVDGFLVEPDADAAVARVAALLADRDALDTVRDRTDAHARIDARRRWRMRYARCAASRLAPGRALSARAGADAASLRDAARAETIARLRDARTRAAHGSRRSARRKRTPRRLGPRARSRARRAHALGAVAR